MPFGLAPSKAASEAQPEDSLQQLLTEREGLRRLLNEQVDTISAHTSRINGLERDLLDMQDATKVSAQVIGPPEGLAYSAEMQADRMGPSKYHGSETLR